jgi:hypothetical protein
LGIPTRREREDFHVLVHALNRSANASDACALLLREHGWQTSPRSLRELFETGRRRFPDLNLGTPSDHLNRAGQVPAHKAGPYAAPASNPAQASPSRVDVKPGRHSFLETSTPYEILEKQRREENERLGISWEMPKISEFFQKPAADRTFVMREEPKGPPTFSGREQTILVCPDTHVPYHDPVAWEVFLNVARKVRPDVLVLIGDFADCEAISSHTKSPTRRHRVVEELDVVNEKLDEIDALRIPRKIWTEGNHERRLTRIVAEKVPELDGMVRTLQEYLKVKERGIEWIPYFEGINVGRMYFTHDVGRCGVNTARQSLLDVGGNVSVGHSHRASVAYQGTTKGEGHVCLNVGWLGSYAEISYLHKARALRDWQHAFGLIDMDEHGCVWGQVIPIVNEMAMVRGQKVAA